MAVKKVMKKAAAKSDTPAPTQVFKAIFWITAGGAECDAGEMIELTRDEFDELKPLGAVEGEWADEPAK